MLWMMTNKRFHMILTRLYRHHKDHIHLFLRGNEMREVKMMHPRSNITFYTIIIVI